VGLGQIDVLVNGTANMFLKLMKDLRIIFLQDSAAMMLEYPERRSHAVFQRDIFNTREFKAFLANMKEVLENDRQQTDDPDVEAVLPGVQAQFTALETGQTAATAMLSGKIAGVEVTVRESNQE